MAASSLSHRSSPFRLGPVQVWFMPALLITVAIHAAAYYLLHITPYTGFATIQPPKSRIFHLKQAQIDPKALEDKKPPTPSEKVPTKPKPDVTDIQIPGELKPSYDKYMQQANTDLIAAPEAARTMAMEKPKVDQNKALDRILAEESPTQLPSDLKALTDSLLTGKPKVSGTHPAFDVTGDTYSSKPNAGPNVGMPNFSDLDSLLSAKGPLSGKTAPILLPTDLLFDYNSASLREAAVGSLQKLADLIQRNPNSTFTIEGHTDSFGTPEYNARLSTARAESVKAWLVQDAGIDPARVTTRGLGMSRLLVQGGTVEQQQLNRRVEIVIKNNRNR